MRTGEDPCSVLRMVIIIVSHEYLQVFALDITAGPQFGEICVLDSNSPAFYRIIFVGLGFVAGSDSWIETERT